MKNVPLIEFRDVHARVAGKEVLNGISFTLYPQEVHAIMGPNGAGKSSIAKVLAGDPSYEVTSGDIFLLGESIKDLSPEDRSRKGVFMSFQNPSELPGVKLVAFLKAILQAKRKAHNEPPLSEEEASLKVQRVIAQFSNDSFSGRDVNVGFSGGEKKRCEVLQMAILDPRVAVLDEIDSGLDIDSLKRVAHDVRSLHGDNGKGLILVTHYKRLLEHIRPDKVHVLHKGKLVASGGFSLVDDLESKGYESFVC